jgi:hypothetical protein
VGCRAAEASDGEDGATEQQQGLAAVAIRGRSEDQRRRAHAQQVDAHRQTGPRGRNAEVAARRGETWQDHVDGKGRRRCEQTQQNGEGEGTRINLRGRTAIIR